MGNKTYIAFIWHHHQPYYKDNQTEKYILPWVRYHSIKDYYDTVAILDEFPKIKMNFNLVPSLLLQIQDYVENNSRDDFWNITVKNANDLTLDDKFFILKNFFSCNWSTMVEIYPRYKKLLDIRGRNASDEALKKTAQKLNNSNFLDLQVWYNLTWVDPYFREKDDFIKGLFAKGSGFTEEEKGKLLDKHIDIMKMIIPKYKEVLARKQIEISTSPFYHPILPLLIDSAIAKISSPQKASPKNVFAHPEDAVSQIKKGIKYHEDIFGEKPKGIWPSEGSVSNDIISILADMGIKWAASDEDILFNSLKKQHNHCDLYNVFRYKNTDLSLLFRDKRLSDLIGFSYSQMIPSAAVQNFMDNLRSIRNNLQMQKSENNENSNLITIILDGENCWEYFEDDGRKFLKNLYSAFENSKEFETITISEYLEKFSAAKKIDDIYPGSWINHNFDIWIGNREENKAWDLLNRTREFLAQYQNKNIKNTSPEILKNAWEEIYIAEGSDWFWWYGDEHNSLNDLEFDVLFRQHLKNVYLLLVEESPIDLNISIIEPKNYKLYNLPIDLISPSLDGKSTNFFEWYNAGFYPVEKSFGSMHQVTSRIKNFYFGFDFENFYFRIDPSIILKSNSKDIIFVLEFDPNFSVHVKFDKDSKKYYLEGFDNKNNKAAFILNSNYVAFDKCFEIQIPFQYFEDIGLDRSKINFILKVFEFGFEVERWPQQDKIFINASYKKYIV